MKIIQQSIEVMTEIPADLNERIERIGRVCYKSEDKITAGSAEKFVKGIVSNGHHSVLEHFSVTVRFITDRGISHEIVRHRIGCSYSQESTRYCNYGKGDVVFIAPPLPEERDASLAYDALEYSETYYKDLLLRGVTPQIARAVLPNSLKTEIIMTANLRAWRHFFELRCSSKAHPQMRELAVSLLCYFVTKAPTVFSDLVVTDCESSVNVEEAFI